MATVKEGCTYVYLRRSLQRVLAVYLFLAETARRRVLCLQDRYPTAEVGVFCMAIMFAGWTCPVAGFLLSTTPFSAIPAPKLTVDGIFSFSCLENTQGAPLAMFVFTALCAPSFAAGK